MIFNLMQASPALQTNSLSPRHAMDMDAALHPNTIKASTASSAKSHTITVLSRPHDASTALVLEMGTKHRSSISSQWPRRTPMKSRTYEAVSLLRTLNTQISREWQVTATKQPSGETATDVACDRYATGEGWNPAGTEVNEFKFAWTRTSFDCKEIK